MPLSSGLFNSARLVAEMLAANEHEVKLVHVVDNNCIDREVTAFRPDAVVIEAYWVVPEKFEILHKLHPNVKWIIRNHSKIPFLANEGIGMDWSLRYMNYPNVYLSSNSAETTDDMRILIGSMKPDWVDAEVRSRTPLLPNYYPVSGWTSVPPARSDDEIHVGCFGAIRPLKNHLAQAIAAVAFAEARGLKLHFHINGTRIEGNGSPVLKNLRQMFENLPEHTLHEHSWMPHEDFCKLVAQMDVGLQVSYTETFNIVCADLVAQGVPVVTSNEIHWIDPIFHADPNDTDSIVRAMGRALSLAPLHRLFDVNKAGLRLYNRRSRAQWMRALDGLTPRPGPWARCRSALTSLWQGLVRRLPHKA